MIKPATPHNTSQFLSTNFCLGRTEKVSNSQILSEYPEGDIKADSNTETDDYCIPGGSMTGKLQGILISEIMHSNTGAHSTEEENENNLRLNLTSTSSEPVVCEEVNNFKLIIENQQKLIGHLFTILNRGVNSEGDIFNADIPKNT